VNSVWIEKQLARFNLEDTANEDDW
jgi:hypothetical protein